MFRWAVDGERGDRPCAWEVVVADGDPRDDVESTARWTMHGRGPGSAGVRYGGPELDPLTQYWWTVRLRDSNGSWSSFVEPVAFVTGLLGASWPASWIAPPHSPRLDSVLQRAAQTAGGDRWIGPAPFCVGTELWLAEKPQSVRAVIAAQGIYEIECNGARVGGARFRPGWTDYATRLPYDVHILDEHLVAGENTVTVTVASGWYCGRVAWLEAVYGTRPSLSAQLQLTMPDGTIVRHGTDETWTTRACEVEWADLVMGEGRQIGAPATNGQASSVEVIISPRAEVVLAGGPPVVVLESIEGQPLEIEPERTVFDFGANIVGVVQLAVQGGAPTRVVVRHAEMLEQSGGALYTENLRTARAVDAYEITTSAGATVEPRFTVHGFRYAEVTGIPAERLRAHALVLGGAIEPTGDFSCSNPLINRFVDNARRSLRGNFLEVPTDTPAPRRTLGMDLRCAGLCAICVLARRCGVLLGEMADRPAGGPTRRRRVPDVAPLVAPDLLGVGAPGWADAGVIVPWILYERYGSRTILQESFDSMCAWVDYLRASTPTD